MDLIIFVFIFIFGTIIGSFLNVVIYRFNTGMKIASGRSICMTCNKTLRWYELIPLFSFLIQSGKCRRCAMRISHQYPLVEFSTGLIFVLLVYKFLPIINISFYFFVFLLIFFAFIFSLLIVISFYDLRHKIIPDKLVYIFIFISFLSIFLSLSPGGPLFILPTLSHLIAGPLLALPFVLLWYFSGGRLMGLGDGKLILGLGWMLGLSAGLFSVIISFWLGTIVSLLLIILSKRISFLKLKNVNLKTEIPFAPFLIFSAVITFLFELDIVFLINLLTF
jgi:prepilin signal peptidase PulO-like enzyme (type II secretory pathway)